MVKVPPFDIHVAAHQPFFLAVSFGVTGRRGQAFIWGFIGAGRPQKPHGHAGVDYLFIDSRGRTKKAGSDSKAFDFLALCPRNDQSTRHEDLPVEPLQSPQ